MTVAIIGVTGPTGAGKTTVLHVLEARGFHVVDCDRLYDRLLVTDDDLRRGLAEAFGPVFLPDGALDRRALAARVFSDPAELEKLNAVVYPAVNAAVDREIARWGEKGLAIDAINLIESGLGRRCGLTVAVTADPAVRLRRIMARDGVDEARARARIAAQKPDEFYRRRCDFTLVNQSGSQREFQALAAEFFDAVFQFYI